MPLEDFGDREIVRPRPIRLGTIHLMLWMAGSAISLAVLRQTFDDWTDERFGLLQKALVLVQAPLYGAALGCLPLVFAPSGDGLRRFPTQPGHWLLLVQGVSILASAASMLVVVQWKGSGSNVTEVIQQLALRESLRLLPTLALTCVAIYSITTWRWRWMFGFMAAGYGLGCLAFAAALLSGEVREMYLIGTQVLWLFQTISALALVVCVIGDRIDGVRRDFLHTTGITVRFVIIVLGWVVPWLFFYVSRP